MEEAEEREVSFAAAPATQTRISKRRRVGVRIIQFYRLHLHDGSYKYVLKKAAQ